jgi:hypothetical protein
MNNLWTIEAPHPNFIDPSTKYNPQHFGKDIALYTKEELLALPIGTPVISIFGEDLKTGNLDLDTRCGFVAYGKLVE